MQTYKSRYDPNFAKSLVAQLFGISQCVHDIQGSNSPSPIVIIELQIKNYIYRPKKVQISIGLTLFFIAFALFDIFYFCLCFDFKRGATAHSDLVVQGGAQCISDECNWCMRATTLPLWRDHFNTILYRNMETRQLLRED